MTQELEHSPSTSLTDGEAPADPRAEGLDGSEIAIIGMACRLPGASTIDQFWRLLRDGSEALRELTDEELRQAGVEEAALRDPAYVRRMPVVDGIEDFDASFFGYTPLEATIMDPQHRLFLECAWEACEQAGYNPEAYPAPIGVFTGAKTNTYLFNVVAQRARFPALDNFQIALGNDLAAMATRVSYKLGLRGPSYALHTACSTSLVAVHLACQSLLLDECKMALAGGAAINVPQYRGYAYQTGGILSPDGSCRTFDAQAAGSNFGNGGGAVLLKRLEDALADGDHVFSVIRGSATNNDGAQKASFTAPGVEGQTAVLLEAMAVAGVEADDISYIEAHGTATQLGDSIEMLALTEAFRASSSRTGYCAIGSAKTNLGHLETAAGVAGLIKTALSLREDELPPSLNFEQPNPQIDFENSPFRVHSDGLAWPPRPASGRRIAGVSSFGIGSTNAHVIVEEPPREPAREPGPAWQLLPLSARTPSALETMSRNLADHLEAHPEDDLADVAFTLGVGRKAFEHRRTVVCRDRESAITTLRSGAAEGGAHDAATELTDRRSTLRRAAFLIPGLGEHAVDMGLGLYQREPLFRETVDRAAELLAPRLGIDLRTVIYPRGVDAEEKIGSGLDLKAMLGRKRPAGDDASRQLDRTVFAQPATFVVEMALARLFSGRGAEARAMIGYSLGEYVCACLAGVLSFEDALALVARRAQLIEDLPAGAMLAVTLDEEALAPYLERHRLSLAAINGVTGCVAAGPEPAIAALEAELAEAGVAHRRVPTTHAFHSTMLEPAIAELTELASSLSLSAPQVPYVSNVTGTWIRDEEATDPAYWGRHMCGTVRFADGLTALLHEDGERALLEVGPGQSLSSFARLHDDCERSRPVIVAMPSGHSRTSDAAGLLGAVGELWAAGVPIDWTAHHAHEQRRRVPLPTYPFERQRYWIDPDEATLARTDGREPAAAPAAAPVKIDDLERWLYRQTWTSEPWPEAELTADDGTWLILADEAGVAEALAERLAGAGAELVMAVPGESFSRGDDGRYRLRPGNPDDHGLLLSELEQPLRRVIHLWNVKPAPEATGDEATFRATQETGFYSLVALIQAIDRQEGGHGPLELDVVTSGVHPVTGDETLVPERATVFGATAVIPQEHPEIVCRTIDVDLPERVNGSPAIDADRVAGRLLLELASIDAEPVVCHRGEERRVRAFEPTDMPPADDAHAFRDGGVYLITGGLGGIGLALSDYLAREHRARLVLTRRTPLPERDAWDEALADDATDERTRRAILQIRALEEAGAEVLAVAADVADESAMRAVVDEALARFDTLHGVIHAAGVLAEDSFKTVAQTGREPIELHFGPKIYGLYVLERVLEGVQLDFCMLYSSLSAILGGLGYVGYATANLFMDFFAARHNRAGGTRWLSVDWDSWHYEEDEDARGGLGTTLSELAMTPSEGIETLRRLLVVPGDEQLVISTGELAPRLEQWVALKTMRAAAQAAASGAQESSGVKAAASGEELEGRIAGVWSRILGTEDVGLEDNFFDLGGNSLLAMQLIADLNQELGVQVAPVVLFEAPTVGALARHLSPEPASGTETAAKTRRRIAETPDVAVIGMSGRFPGAGSVEAFWDNLCNARETISFFTDDELLAAGIDPETLCDPSYVKARPILDDVESFDAALFGYSPREAEIMDPQHRLFLECAWEALEDAGYDTQRYDGRVGVFAGASISSYMQGIYTDPEVLQSVDTFQILLGNEKDSLTTKVSYKLDLTGPSMAIQTFCSTSLVAVHAACQSLLTGEADMALAGGISIIVPQKSGYRHQEGGINSQDGHVRAFDAKATGMVFGNGAGLVVLKTLEAALEDGDRVYAVIKGTAINNDGSLKAGYSAASIEGQSAVVAEALERAAVDPATVTYVEAHGSGTGLGDPVEMEALSRAFRAHTDRKQYCAVGSVKSNVGHLDRAAGVTGLIKAVLALKNRQIPASLHFEEPNPEIDFASSPFYVNTELTEWQAEDGPRRAGVTSLGIGGTNAHAVIEEAPEPTPGEPRPGPQLIVLSANTREALDAASDRLADALEGDELDWADVAYTLQVGRRQLGHRRALVAADATSAVPLLRREEPARLLDGVCADGRRQVAFLFPGQGSQYPDMGRELYEHEPVFRRHLDRCAELLSGHLGLDLREVLYPQEVTEEAHQQLAETRLTQPALFAVEYAAAQMWMAWGIRPEVMIGHSVGEYVAACLAGVFSLEDALALVAERGRLIQELPAGDMLAIPLPESEVQPWIEREELSLAAVNAPDRVVVSGTSEAIGRLAERLAGDGVDGHGVDARRLHTSHAFHSALLEPAVEPFVSFLSGIERHEPKTPFVSGLTGTWITPEQATDPAYWGAQLRCEVRFSAGIQEVLAGGSRVLLEVGPGRTLTTLSRRHLDPDDRRPLIASLPSPRDTTTAFEASLNALGRLWLAGLTPNWTAVHADTARRRVSLPTYPFARQRCWIDGAPGGAGQAGLTAGSRPEQWLFDLVWKTSRTPRPPAEAGGSTSEWLLLSDGGPLAEALEQRLRRRDRVLTVARKAESFAELDDNVYTLGARQEHLERLVKALPEPPGVVLYLWSLDDGAQPREIIDTLLHLAHGLEQRATGEIALWVLSRGLIELTGQEPAEPALASLPAVCRAITHGTGHLTCHHLDVLDGDLNRLPKQILAEIAGEPEELTLAYRGSRRWVPAIEAIYGAEPGPAAEPLPVGGWLLTGALNEPGFSLAGTICSQPGQKLALLESEALPPREEWEQALAATSPSAEELAAFLRTLATDRGIDFDMKVRGAEIPERMERLTETADRRTVPEDFDAMADALCAAYAHTFFSRHVDTAAGRDYSPEELREQLELVPKFERFFQYLLHVLARAEMIEQEDGRVRFREVSPEQTDPETLGELVKERYPDFSPGIDCVAHCAAFYSEVFSGAMDPVSVLFPNGSSKMLTGVMETQDRYSINRIFYPLMSELIREAAAGLSHRPLRILEFGAGDGNLTWELAESLRGENVEYHFTDIGRAFVVGGQKTAAERGLDFMHFGMLDVTRDAAEQGYDPFSFDVLLAFDVVHATPDVRQTMTHLKRLLVPGGWTMILEPTRDQHWISLIWGLAEGWWLFADEELRTLHPLLEPGRWQTEVLNELEGSYAGVFPLDEAARATVDHSLLVVQQPVDLRSEEYLATAAERWSQRQRQIADRIGRVQRLEHLGAEVAILEATTAAEISHATAQVRGEWGSLAGVVHADGPWTAAGATQDLDPGSYHRLLAAESETVAALETGLDEAPVDLALLVSPLTAASGESSGIDQAADLERASRADRQSAGRDWRSLVWGVPVDVAGTGGGLPPHLAAAALAAVGESPDLARVIASHRWTPLMASAWNLPPRLAPQLDELAVGSASADYAAPVTEEQKGVAAIWQQVLGVTRVGLYDSFFELGGDSLITTQIHSQLHRAFGVQVPIEQLFERLTVAEQAELVAEALAAEQAEAEEAILAQLAEMSDEEAHAEIAKLVGQDLE